MDKAGILRIILLAIILSISQTRGWRFSASNRKSDSSDFDAPVDDEDVESFSGDTGRWLRFTTYGYGSHRQEDELDDKKESVAEVDIFLPEENDSLNLKDIYKPDYFDQDEDEKRPAGIQGSPFDVLDDFPSDSYYGYGNDDSFDDPGFAGGDDCASLEAFGIHCRENVEVEGEQPIATTSVSTTTTPQPTTTTEEPTTTTASATSTTTTQESKTIPSTTSTTTHSPTTTAQPVTTPPTTTTSEGETTTKATTTMSEAPTTTGSTTTTRTSSQPKSTPKMASHSTTMTEKEASEVPEIPTTEKPDEIQTQPDEESKDDDDDLDIVVPDIIPVTTSTSTEKSSTATTTTEQAVTMSKSGKDEAEIPEGTDVVGQSTATSTTKSTTSPELDNVPDKTDTSKPTEALAPTTTTTTTIVTTTTNIEALTEKERGKTSETDDDEMTTTKSSTISMTTSQTQPSEPPSVVIPEDSSKSATDELDIAETTTTTKQAETTTATTTSPKKTQTPADANGPEPSTVPKTTQNMAEKVTSPEVVDKDEFDIAPEPETSTAKVVDKDEFDIAPEPETSTAQAEEDNSVTHAAQKAQFSITVLIICIVALLIVLILVIVIIVIVRARLKRRGKYSITSEVDSEEVEAGAEAGQSDVTRGRGEKVVTVQYNDTNA